MRNPMRNPMLQNNNKIQLLHKEKSVQKYTRKKQHKNSRLEMTKSSSIFGIHTIIFLHQKNYIDDKYKGEKQ